MDVKKNLAIGQADPTFRRVTGSHYRIQLHVSAFYPQLDKFREVRDAIEAKVEAFATGERDAG